PGVVMAPSVIEGKVEANGDVRRPFFITIANWENFKDQKVELNIRLYDGNQWIDRNQFIKIVSPKK
ncbi:MAG: hypothetical protein AAF203_08135, partial [Pseudomonadota bacterium]